VRGSLIGGRRRVGRRGGSGFPEGVSSALTQSIYSARFDTENIDAGYLTDSRRYRVGTNITTYLTNRAANQGGPQTRINAWNSLNDDNPLQFSTAVYMDDTVSESGVRVISLVGKPGEGVTERVTVTVDNTVGPSISWVGSVSGSWGSTTGSAPASAPFTATATNQGWVNGSSHVFDVVADASCACNATTFHPEEGDRILEPTDSGELPASGRFWYGVVQRPSGLNHTIMSRAEINTPSTPTNGAEELHLYSAGYTANAVQSEFAGAYGNIRTAAAVVGAGIGNGVHLVVGGVSGNRHYTWTHVDRALHNAKAHEASNAGNVPIATLSAATQPVYRYCNGSFRTWAQHLSDGWRMWEFGYGDGNLDAEQYRVWNDWIQANALATYGVAALAEFAQNIMYTFSHSVRASISASRMQTNLTSACVWSNHSVNGRQTTEVESYMASVLPCVDFSELAGAVVNPHEGLNQALVGATVALKAEWYATHLSVAAQNYMQPGLNAGVKVLLGGIYERDIGVGGNGIDALGNDNTETQAINDYLDANAVTNGWCDAFEDANESALTRNDHDNATYWTDQWHLTEPTGQSVLETELADLAKGLLGIP
jgi:hypothetical protein